MIIDSLLDTDLYKLTMMQAVLHNAPAANVEYRFLNRTSEVDLRPYLDEINHEIDHLCELRFTKKELNYLQTLRFFKSEYLEFLRIFQLNRDFIKVTAGAENLEIAIKGPWLHTIMFEIPVLAIVSEIYFRNFNKHVGRERLQEKIQIIKSARLGNRFHFADFGTRRRFSRAWQGELLQLLLAEIPQHITGTSNLYYANKFDIKPMGTMAHEYFQAYQALGPRLVDSQKAALESWANEYRGDLGIALSDTYGIEVFLRDFDLYFCKLFDGVRHDSGDPFVWGEKVLEHYSKMRIDAHTKTLAFSDALTINLAIKLFEHFNDRTNIGFGIGTNLTNDVGYSPLNIVIKMVRCNDQAVAKISDEPRKAICDDPSYLTYLKHVFKISV
ncbi:MAG: nicotinate phosphoribosyltransferase [Gammaproteobacteria bacterium]|nr:nicotinate phosphoribosyltransferase [Gammaproteobacteria bacterium]